MAAVPTGAIEKITSELLGLFADDGWFAAGMLIWVLGEWWLLKHQQVAASKSADAAFAAGLLVVLAFNAMRRARMRTV